MVLLESLLTKKMSYSCFVLPTFSKAHVMSDALPITSDTEDKAITTGMADQYTRRRLKVSDKFVDCRTSPEQPTMTSYIHEIESNFLFKLLLFWDFYM